METKRVRTLPSLLDQYNTYNKDIQVDKIEQKNGDQSGQSILLEEEDPTSKTKKENR